MGLSDSLEKMIALATGSNDPIALKSVMEVQKELIEIQNENRHLREENHNLKNIQILESELEYHEGVFYHKAKERYICATCWENKNKYISVSERSDDHEGKKVYWCETCKRPRFTNILSEGDS